ncbi:MAG: ATP-binding cassette domain-containing protein [Candidatus Falkowbacteria bacterium]
MLKISNLCYKTAAKNILQGISFSLAKGEIVGIIGPNGSGKSTLLNCISGFNVPTDGKIYFNKKIINNLKPDRIASMGIGRVFQQSGVFKDMSVIENVIISIENRFPKKSLIINGSRKYKANFQEAMDYLTEIGLADRAHEKASSLSGGQMRLLEIIRTFAFGSDLFLLDEPTAGVSPKMKNDLEKLILKLKKENKSVLIVEHDINFIKKFCTRIIVLDVGKVVLEDEPSSIQDNPLLKLIYFGK